MACIWFCWAVIISSLEETPFQRNRPERKISTSVESSEPLELTTSEQDEK